MSESFIPSLLHADQIDYELRIRGCTTVRDVESRCKVLSRALRSKPYDDLSLTDPLYNFNTERLQVNNSLEVIRHEISELEHPTEDELPVKSIKSQLVHCLYRINRKPIPEQGSEEETTFQNESRATIYLLESDLCDKLGVNDQDVVVNVENTVHEVAASTGKFVPLYKWGITFDGQPNNVISFVERVEELAVARNVTKHELFRSGLDLFTGPALQWYRSVRAGNEVRNWESLVEQLKNDFLHDDFNKSMLDYIEKRTQHVDEPVHIYIRIMEALYNRLKDKPCLSERIKQIKKNLLPYFATPLALLEFDSISELISKCKKIEYAEESTKKYVPPPVKSNLVEKDLLYVGISSPDKVSGSNNPQLSLGQAESKEIQLRNKSRRSNVNVVGVNKEPVKCWNCKGENHVFRECKAKRNKFCFKCGEPNVTISSCKNCSKNN